MPVTPSATGVIARTVHSSRVVVPTKSPVCNGNDQSSHA